MILITGATGRAGVEVVRALIERGEHVRVLVRDPERARALLGEAVELAVGDYADPGSVRAALAGVDAVFLSGPDDPRRVGWECDLVDAAAVAGVGRIVKLSSFVAERGSAVAFWDWHARIEEHLEGSGVPAVFLRSSFSMSNLLAAAEQIAYWGRIHAPAGQARIAMVDPRDVGACAAAVLTGAGADGVRYALTGPAAVTYTEVAEALSAAAGRRIGYGEVSDRAALRLLTGAGVPPFAAEQVVAIFVQARLGALQAVTSDVAALTGRPPYGIDAFARAHASSFTSSTRAA